MTLGFVAPAAAPVVKGGVSAFARGLAIWAGAIGIGSRLPGSRQSRANFEGIWAESIGDWEPIPNDPPGTGEPGQNLRFVGSRTVTNPDGVSGTVDIVITGIQAPVSGIQIYNEVGSEGFVTVRAEIVHAGGISSIASAGPYDPEIGIGSISVDGFFEDTATGEPVSPNPERDYPDVTSFPPPPPNWGEPETVTFTDGRGIERTATVTPSFGTPVIEGGKLRFPGGVTSETPSGRTTSWGISLDFSPGGAPVAIPTPSVAPPGTAENPEPTPIQLSPGTPTNREPQAPGVEIALDFRPPEFRPEFPELKWDAPPIELPDLDDFWDGFPELELDFDISDRQPTSTDTKCPDPCGEIDIEFPEFPEFPDLASPEPMVVGADIESIVPSGLASLTVIERGETKFFLPRLGTCLWIDSGGNRSNPVDLKVLHHRLTPPDFSGEWVDVEVLPAPGIEIEVNLIQGEKFPDIRFEE